MADENTMDDIVASFAGLRFLAGDQSAEAMAATIAAIDEQRIAGVVVPQSGAIGVGRLAGSTIAPPVEGQLLATCVPMTDAIKRVEKNRVVETVDREQLTIVELPMVLPIGLAKRWAATVLDRVAFDDRTPGSADEGAADELDVGAPGRRLTAAALLSQLVLIEPDLRVVGIDDIS